MNKIAKYLNQHLVGNVFDRPEILSAYATDRSIVKIEPKMVVVPENTNDVRRIVRFVNQLATKNVKLEIAVRGSGLDKTGADLGPDLLVSMEHMNHIQEIDERSRLIRVQAGATLGDINDALSLVGLTLPISADPRETIGSLISNFSSEAYYYTDCLEAVISTGDVIQTSRFSRRGLNRKEGLTSTEGTIYRDLHGLIEDNFDIVSDLSRKNTIDGAGYQMITQVYREKGHTFDLMPIFFAAQGTLGIITEVIMRCELLPEEPVHFAAAFNSAEDAISYANEMKPLDPYKIDFYDARIFATSANSGKDTTLFSKKFENGYIIIVAFNERARKSNKKIAKCLKRLPETAAAVVETEENTTDFSRVQSALISFMNDDLRGERAPVVDDFYVPADHLKDFLKDLRTQEKIYNLPLPLFGSFLNSNYSVRLDIRINSVDGRQLAVRAIKDFASLLGDVEGSLTGGSPEGRTKAIMTNGLLSDGELELYQKIKDIFDPNHIFNPDIKLGAELKDTVKSLRTSNNIGITS